MRFAALLIATITSFTSVVSAFDASSNKNVALYWGQASAGSQESLASYCDNDDADIFILSFLIGFTDPITLNFAAACTETGSDGVLKCDQIGEDIKTCQSNGKKVLLSLGGAAGSYGFTSDDEGTAFAETLWNYFGEGSTENRPFGDAVVDGFDFDIENNDQTGYVALAKELRTYFATGSKDYYLGAAPQCVYPDASVGDLLAEADIDFAFVQFYNNYCSIDGQFNWDTWANYAQTVSPNKDIKLYLGLAASSTAAGSGYVDINAIEETLSTIASDANFGGVMLWDASQSAANTVNGSSFAGAIKKFLNSISGGSTTSSSVASTSSSTSSTSSLTPSSTSSSSTTLVLVPSSTSTQSSSTTLVLVPSSTSTQASSTTLVLIPSSTSAQASSKTTSLYSSSTQIPVETDSGITVIGVPVAVTSTTTVGKPVAITVTLADLNNKEPSISISATKTEGTTLSTVQTSSSSSLASVSPSDVSSSGCSTLSGSDKVNCLNAQFEAGQFSASPDYCETDEYACSADGAFAMCSNGAWVTVTCAAGTTCYAFAENGNVLIGCNYA
jgi:chitinase